MFAVMCGTRGNAIATEVPRVRLWMCSATSTSGRNGLCAVSPTETAS